VGINDASQVPFHRYADLAPAAELLKAKVAGHTEDIDQLNAKIKDSEAEMRDLNNKLTNDLAYLKKLQIELNSYQALLREIGGPRQFRL